MPADRDAKRLSAGSVALGVFLGSTVLACSAETTLVPPPPPPPGGDVVLQILPDTSDQVTAGALGWTSGIPNAIVQLGNPQTSDTIASFTTDAGGRVTLSGLSASDYVLWARRWLGPTELNRLSTADDALGFVAKVPSFRVFGIAETRTVSVRASRRGMLGFAEWAMQPLDEPVFGGYYDGGYVVVANNTDSTMYLDGMLLGIATSQPTEIPGAPCADRIAFYSTPLGVWTAQVYRFPGSGRDNPIPAGGRKMVATDAIDHRAVLAQGYDLRGADFEMLSYADVDNPGVPNLVSAGLREPIGGHGLAGNFGSDVWYLALPTDLASLPRGTLPFTTSQLMLLPADRILDVVTHMTPYNWAYPLCGTYVHPRFDSNTPQLLGPTMYDVSMQRLRTGDPRDGPYQRSRSSDADFVRGAKSAPR